MHSPRVSWPVISMSSLLAYEKNLSSDWSSKKLIRVNSLVSIRIFDFVNCSLSSLQTSSFVNENDFEFYAA